ncbi:MAG: heat-inducible transcriptional repressor HrcA [Acidobacteriia bacterium]|nr:heat-inducible transcriptional repressor HrcA [Terriglobia bacterium]
MVKANLDPRSHEILVTLVRTYIEQGEPVGSATILRRRKLGLSPATIRSILARLEEEGYLVQPHPSAGRVPTDKGYRLFVDALAGESRIRADDKNFIKTSFSREFEEAPQPLERVSHLLAEISNHVGLVVASHMVQNELQHIEFIRLSPHRILVVLVTKPGIVQNRLLMMDEPFTQSELDQTAKYLMANFPGKSLAGIRRELQLRLREEKTRCDELLEKALLICQQRELTEEENSTEVFVDGASRMVNESTVLEVEKLKELLGALEEKSRLLRLLDECLTTRDVGIRVFIGSENRGTELTHCSVITAPYWSNGQVVGSLGIIGPKRMSYDRTIGVVDYMAKMVSQMLSKN